MKNAKDWYWEEKRRRRREEIRGARKKWTAKRGCRFYIIGLPTEHRIIFFWAVALNFIGILLKFALKFWKSLQIFLRPLANPSVTVCQSTRVGFAVSVGKSFDKCVDRPSSLTVMRVGMCAIYRWMCWYICRWMWQGP